VTTPASSPYRIAVLASGEGTNLQALIDAIAAGELQAKIVAVFSDRFRCRALERARDAGIPAIGLAARAYPSRTDFDAALFKMIDVARPDLIVCAGYMRLITAAEVEARSNRMINLHPSLLPAFKGLHTHQQALDADAIEHGASVHVVTAGLDDGPVIAQARVAVLAGDTAETLSKRVRAQEHPLLVEVVRLLAAGALRLSDGRIYLNGERLSAPLQLRANQRLA
jgi:phosphoribosylglycinamide formyltransferase 1